MVDDNFSYDWVLEQLDKDSDIEGICRIGFTEDGYEVFIVGEDDKLSSIPHFHYRKKIKGKPCEFHTCIRFDEAKYYFHTGNEKTLDANQKKYLVKFLNTKHKSIKYNGSNWELLLLIWNAGNETQVNDEKKMPDYTNLL